MDIRILQNYIKRCKMNGIKPTWTGFNNYRCFTIENKERCGYDL
ncbi:hypothetical protein [Clostridium yunnanense]|nr:hypothetical protein [Clostridium yunnanense]